MARDSKDIPLSKHLEELRKRLLISVIALLLTSALAFVFHKWILRFLMGPAGGFEGLPSGGLVFTEVTEMVSITFKVSLLVGLVLALPVVLYELVAFVAPGLTPRERRYLFLFLPGTMFAFVAGALFGYYFLIPPAMRFLLTFGSDIATPMIRISNYMNVIIALLFWMGVVFETPVVMFLLARLGILSYRLVARSRRYAAVAAFVLGALITPTFDPVNQTLVALPIIGLYEIGIWLTKLAERLRRGTPLPEAEPQESG